MTARDVLSEIEQRVDRMTAPDPTGRRRYAMSELGHIAPDTYLTEADRAAGDFDCIAHITADLRSLVAALRAVLDELDRCDVVTEKARNEPWSSVRYMPAVAEVSALRTAITDALSGVTAGTDR